MIRGFGVLGIIWTNLFFKIWGFGDIIQMSTVVYGMISKIITAKIVKFLFFSKYVQIIIS